MSFLGNLQNALLLLILSVLLFGCSNGEPQEVVDSADLAGDKPYLTETPTPTITDTVTSTPSVEPSYTATEAPTVTYTPTPIPSPTATPTLTPEVCQSTGQVITGRHASQIAGPKRTYRIYLPPCYGEDGRVYPVLYMFHGNASSESQWDDLGLDDAAEIAILNKESPPFIIVMPAGGYLANNSSGGQFSFEGMVMNELIPHIEASYCAWAVPAGRTIGGLSRGGYWALEIAFRNASTIGSVGAHSAALVDTHAGPDLNPQYTALTHDLSDLRIYMDVGANDWYIPNFRRLHEDMAAANIAHTWLINEGQHEDSYWAGHVGDYVSWYSSSWPRDRESYPLCNGNSSDSQ